MNEKLSIAEFHQTEAYRNLSPQRQALVDAYLTNGGDRTTAIRAAYPSAKKNSMRTMSCEYFKCRSVVVALAVANGYDPDRVQFDIDLNRAIKNPKTTRTQIAALRLFAETRGYTMPVSKAPKADDTRFKVGDICLQDGQKYQVTAVNEDGQPTAANEVE
jgi:hypothetical protein